MYATLGEGWEKSQSVGVWINVTPVLSLAKYIIFAKYDLLLDKFQHCIWQGKKIK